MRRVTFGLAFLVAWALVGYVIPRGTFYQFLFASSGGNSESPGAWALARNLGVSLFPVLLIFGGAPAAVQIARGRPWRMVAAVALGLCWAAWLLAKAIAVWAPNPFGWIS